MKKTQHVVGLSAWALLVAGGCATRTQSGAAIGAGAGVAIGAGVSSFVSTSAGAGALLGAGMGAFSGAIIGNELDEQDRRRDQELRDAGATTRPAGSYVANEPIRRQDVIAWKKHGVADSVIIDRIERNSVRMQLTAADENSLRENGVSEDVINAMRGTR